MNAINNFISLTLQLSIPIVLGAISGTIAERGGIIFLGVEGMMLIGAFCAVAASHFTGVAYLGLLFAIAMGGLIGYIYALFCIKYKAQQSVIGVGVNLFASGITAVALKVIWEKEGMSGTVNSVKNFNLKFLKNIPILGAFAEQSFYLYLMFFIVFAVWLVFYKTKIGLRYRAIGDAPYAVLTAGVNVNKYRYIAMSIAGAIAAIAGSYLSISQNNLFVVDMTAGRGFMGLAANIFGGWHPIGSLGAGIVFSIAQTGRFYISGNKIPSQFVQMLPYVINLLILMFIGKRAKNPEGLGKLVD